MKLNKKVTFGMIAAFFAVATVFNMGMLNDNGVGDVSLDAFAHIAIADGEDDYDGDCSGFSQCSGDGSGCKYLSDCGEYYIYVQGCKN